jgi:4-alpha-glucanotransferase
MLSATDMLPCAEDLGTVPEASYRTLLEYGIPGIDFQRYLKNQGASFAFKNPFEYRPCSAAVLSTHDSSFFFNWWKAEAGTMDEKLFEMQMEKQGVPGRDISELKRTLFNRRLSTNGRLYWKDEINSRELFLSIVHPNHETENSLSYAYMDSYGEKWKLLEYLGYHEAAPNEINTKLVYNALEKINSASSIFSIQPIHEYLALDGRLLSRMEKSSYRINTPGSVNNRNWSQLLPCSLEELKELEINPTVKEILEKTERTQNL